MRGTLEYHKFLRFPRADDFINEPVFIVDAAAPATVHSSERFWLAYPRVPVSFDVLDERIDPLQGFAVFKLPADVFVPGARREIDIHVRRSCHASMSSCLCASPRSKDSIDSRRTRWFASDQKGSGASETTSNGSRRRMTDWRRKRRTALVRSSPVFAKSESASLRRFESTRICSVDVAMSSSFTLRTHDIVSQMYLNCKEFVR